ncbi:outer membrane transport energization protein TonB [Paraburkholderia bryophila]|uniref:Outer membrane transport energization protein TonB n=2 Tax=Paraburkholderia bryophila TaxID=420952 RepID=A0A329CUR7_9BURK|nr:outer membrane transport energization protein TonB [Paraburkholderia bryophila]
MRLAGFIDAAPTMRMVLAVVVAALVWFTVLVALGHWLGTSAPVPPHEPPLEMRVVELEPPPAPQPKEPVSHVLRAANQPVVKPAKPVAPRPDALPQHIAPKPADARPAQNTVSTVSSPPSATSESGPTAESATHAPPAPADEKQNASTGDTAAHPIAQPLPDLPDDLREQAYQTVATARFTIHSDGSIDVDLIRPTPNPRLNQILLEVLHKWRFSPAMQTGHPVESRQDIRVHFNVD